MLIAAGELRPDVILPLQNGDHLTRCEFERRYEAMPQGRKAELIEGVVYMPSPVTYEEHGGPHFNLVTLLGQYCFASPGVHGGDNTTVRLDLDNEPQPDIVLFIDPQCGGQLRPATGRYLEGSPEIVVEVTASTASIDLHAKLNAYRRNGVREYVVWRVLDRAIDWFVLREGAFVPMTIGADGIFRSSILPGLWLDAAAVLREDWPAAVGVMQQGLVSREHAEFVERLRQRRQSGTP